MKHFIRNKLLIMSGAFALSIALISGIFAAMSFGANLIETNFMAGALLVGLSPMGIFSMAFFYQRKVILPMRQIFVFAPASLSKWQKAIVRSAKRNYTFAKWVPLIITVIAAIEAVGFLPGTIGRELMNNKDIFNQIFAASILSANILLFFKMVDQMIAAKESFATSAN